MVAIVGRKKKDADRVNYNITRSIRSAVLREADRLNRNEIDVIEDLLMFGLAAKKLLESGELAYADLNREIEAIRNDSKATEDDVEKPGGTNTTTDEADLKESNETK